MKLIIFAATLVSIASATRIDPSVLYLWLRSTPPSRWLSSGPEPKDFLDVCDPRSKNTEQEVMEILQTTFDSFQNLAGAIDQDDMPSILNIIRKSQGFIEKEVSAIEGTIFAAVKANTGHSIPGTQMRCAKRLLDEFKILYKTLMEVQSVTTLIIRDFKQQTGDVKFYDLQQAFNILLMQIKQFIQDPKSVRPLQATCRASWKVASIEEIIEDLKQFIEKMKTQDEELKGSAAEAATGLLTQAITLTAVCSSVEYVNQSAEDAVKNLQNDVKMSKNVVDELEPIVEAIVGRPGFLRRLFG